MARRRAAALLILLLSSSTLAVLQLPVSAPLHLMAGWTFLNFKNLPLPSYPAENSTLTGLTVSSERLFLCSPRLREGVPATLSWIPRSEHALLNRPLAPYPSEAWQRGHRTNCSGFVSVHRTRLDSCSRLWVLDSGRNVNTSTCPPKLFLFDTHTDSILKVIPLDVLSDTSLLTSLVLDENPSSQNCDDMFIYITDVLSSSLLVYDVTTRTSWTIEHETFTPDPPHAGLEGTLTIGTMGSERVLFYQSNLGLYAVPTAALQQRTHPLPAVLLAEQSSLALLSDMGDALLVSPADQLAVLELHLDSGKVRTLVRDRRLQHVADMSWDQQGAVWLLTNRLPRFLNGTYHHRDLNLRVMRILR